MNHNEEPKVDWQLEYMNLAKEFLQYIVNVHTVIPEYRTIARRIMDERSERGKEKKEEMVKFLFQRYGIEYNEENLKQYHQSEYDFWGECLDARDTDDGGYYIPPHPTTTHNIIIAIDWSNLVQNVECKRLLEMDLEDADFRLPGDHSESKGGIHYPPEDREDMIARLKIYADYLNVETFIGNLNPIDGNPKEVLEKLGIKGDCSFGWFTSSRVNTWLKWSDDA